MTARKDRTSDDDVSSSLSASNRPDFTSWVSLRLDETPQVGLWLLILVIAVKFSLTAVFNYTVFSVPPNQTPVFGPIMRVTDGLVTSQLLVGLFQLVVIIGGLVWLIDGLHPVHVGLDWDDIQAGIIVTGVVWIVIQFVGLIVSGITGPVTFSPLWEAIGSRGMLSNLLAEVFGTAPMEEAIYRGLFLTQGYLLARRFLDDRRLNLFLAIVGSQALFALAHVPTRLVVGTQLGLPLGQDLLLTFVLGTIFSLVYLRTGNLFIAMGVHALSNDPTSLFLEQPIARVTVGLCVVIVLIGWPRVRRIRSRPNEGDITGY